MAGDETTTDDQTADGSNHRTDAINAPPHYLQAGSTDPATCLDPLALMAATGEDVAYAKWAIITYVYRYAAKGQAQEDLLKALFYLGWLLACVWGLPTDQKRQLARLLADTARCFKTGGSNGH